MHTAPACLAACTLRLWMEVRRAPWDSITMYILAPQSDVSYYALSFCDELYIIMRMVALSFLLLCARFFFFLVCAQLYFCRFKKKKCFVLKNCTGFFSCTFCICFWSPNGNSRLIRQGKAAAWFMPDVGGISTVSPGRFFSAAAGTVICTHL